MIKRALQSILAQKYTHFEVCVVDNNTDKNTSEQVQQIVDEAKEKRNDISWIYIHSDKAFASGARNDGIAATSGKYIVFLDDDDELLEGSLTIRVQQMEQDTALALLYCAGYSKIHPYPFKMYRYYHYCKQLHTDRLLMMSCSSIIINRWIFDKHNLRFDEKQSRLDDYDLCRKVIVLNLKVKSIPDALVLLNLHYETRISSHTVDNYNFRKALIDNWGNSADEYTYDYVKGVFLWRKCFGIEESSYKEIKNILKKKFNKSPSLIYKLKFKLLALSPILYLSFYHLGVTISQVYKNSRARRLNKQQY